MEVAQKATVCCLCTMCCSFVLQLVAFMHTEEELMAKFPGLDLGANLQQGSSAAAVTAMLGSTHMNASAAAAAAAAMGGVLSTAAAAANTAAEAAAVGLAVNQDSAAVSGQLSTAEAAAVHLQAAGEAVFSTVAQEEEEAAAAASVALSNAPITVAAANTHHAEEEAVVSMAAREEAAAALAAAVLDSASSAVDPVYAGLSNLLARLAAKAGAALQHLATVQAADTMQGQQWSPERLLAQLQALQQRLPGQGGVADLVADYQAWLDQLKAGLMQQQGQVSTDDCRI
jgi:hypothetical protein